MNSEYFCNSTDVWCYLKPWYKENFILDRSIVNDCIWSCWIYCVIKVAKSAVKESYSFPNCGLSLWQSFPFLNCEEIYYFLTVLHCADFCKNCFAGNKHLTNFNLCLTILWQMLKTNICELWANCFTFLLFTFHNVCISSLFNTSVSKVIIFWFSVCIPRYF